MSLEYEEGKMMYPFMTFGDGTEVVHSEAYFENETEKVRVFFEKPVYGGFESAYCTLPDYHWTEIEGFSKEDIESLQGYLESVAHIIIGLAREGGFASTANI